MAEELGRIQRPPASQYDGRRKLLLVPLIYGPQADNVEEPSLFVSDVQITTFESTIRSLPYRVRDMATGRTRRLGLRVRLLVWRRTRVRFFCDTTAPINAQAGAYLGSPHRTA